METEPRFVDKSLLWLCCGCVAVAPPIQRWVCCLSSWVSFSWKKESSKKVSEGCLSYILHITLSIHHFNHVWTVCGCVLCCRRHLEYSEETPSWPRVRQLWHNVFMSLIVVVLFIYSVYPDGAERNMKTLVTWRRWWQTSLCDRGKTDVIVHPSPSSTIWRWEHWWWLLAAGDSSFI